MSITVPYTFSNATTADALEVNANFAAILAKAFDKTGDTVTGAFAATGSFNVGAATSVVLVATQTAGDLIYASTSSAVVRLAKGTAYQVLHMNAGATAPAWTSTLGETGTRLTAGFFTDLTVTNAITGSVTGASASCSGNAATATALATARAINGVDFNGTAAITVTAAAGTLTGTTLNSTVVTSSLTTVGTITSGVWNAGAVTSSGTVTAGSGGLGVFAGDYIYRNSATGLFTVYGSSSGDSGAWVKVYGPSHATKANAISIGAAAETFLIAGATGNTTIAGTLTANGFGAHAFSAGGTGANALQVRNPTDGTGNSSYISVGTDLAVTQGYMQAFASSYTTSGPNVAGGVLFGTAQAGGISIASMHASGAIRFYTGGTTLRGEVLATGVLDWAYGADFAGDFSVATSKFTVASASGNTVVAGTFTAAGDVGIAATKKFYFDGVGLAGDTYITEYSSNLVEHVVGGNKVLTLTGDTVFCKSPADTTSINISDWIYAPGIDTGTGTALVLTSGNYIVAQTSTETTKQNITRGWAPSKAVQDAFLALAPIQYDYLNTPGMDLSTGKSKMVAGERGLIGFSAEEAVASGVPGLVNLDSKGQPWSLREHGFMAYHHAVLRDHDSRIAALEAKLAGVK